MTALPEAAALHVRRIEALLDEAEAILAKGGATDEAAFSLRETRSRYLPDTINAYLDVPASLRHESDAGGKTPDERLIAQLDHLERATAQRLRELAARSTDTIAANGAFLTERFGAAEALPEAGPIDVSAAPPATLMRTFFDRLARDASTQAGGMIAVAADKFSAVVPQLVRVQRGMFGMGAVEAFTIDVPVADFAVRYSLAARRGGIDATATKVVRGVALKTISVDLDAWLHDLYESLAAFIERDRAARETLSRFLEH